MGLRAHRERRLRALTVLTVQGMRAPSSLVVPSPGDADTEGCAERGGFHLLLMVLGTNLACESGLAASRENSRVPFAARQVALVVSDSL